MIFINFKTYEEASGERALSLLKIIEEVAIQTQIKIIPVVQTVDLRNAVTNSKLEIWVQKIDPVSYGANTGFIVPQEIVSAGARGTFLNHSENKIGNFETLKESNQKAKEVGLKTLIFCSTLEELEENKAINSDFISYEPPELVGGEVSVSSSQPEMILKAAEITKTAGVPLIVGAGINSREDVRKCMEFGAVGVAVASAVVKSPNPKEKLIELTEGF